MRRILATALLAACAVPNPWTDQHNYADSLRPAVVKPSTAASGAPLRVFRVRAYADEEYQAQTPRWNAHIEEQLNRASAVLEAQFGVRLELESARPWQRTGSSARLADVLGQLQLKDNGAQVDWVIGYTASLDVFSAAQDQLGIGMFFGKHFLLRGMASAAELDAINAALPLLSAQDRENLVRQRRLHKETSVLLHEWAHTLGAFHDRSNDTLMAPSYDQSMAQFSDASARIVGIGLEHRGVTGGREEWAKAYRKEVARAGDAIWDAIEKQHVLAAADQFFASSGELEADDEKKFNEVSLREHAGDYPKAQQLIAPLVARYPRSAMVQELSCSIAQEAHNDELAACRRAAGLANASMATLLLTAHLEIAAGNQTNAIPLLNRGEAKLTKEPTGWLYLAQLELTAGALTAAERAAKNAKSKKGADIAAESARTKAFIGFPKQPLNDREAEYVVAALAAHDQIDKGKFDAALAKALELEKTFPGTPAAAVVACRVRSRGKSLEQIQGACGEAAKGAPGAFLPQYILGLVESAQSRWPDAEASLRRAIEIDGSTREVWASLAAVQLKQNKTAAAQESREKYKERFGSPLLPTLWPRGWAAR
jgi:predicted Zn-dependent protease